MASHRSTYSDAGEKRRILVTALIASLLTVVTAVAVPEVIFFKFQLSMLIKLNICPTIKFMLLHATQEYIFIASYYRQLSADIKMKNFKIKTGF